MEEERAEKDKTKKDKKMEKKRVKMGSGKEIEQGRITSNNRAC